MWARAPTSRSKNSVKVSSWSSAVNALRLAVVYQKCPSSECANTVLISEQWCFILSPPVSGRRCEGFMAEQPSGKRPVQVDKDLLAILCCPDTKLDVSLADEALINKMNDAVSRGVLKNEAQKPVTELLDGGLIRADRKILYPIREDIPVMLIEEGIPLDQIL